MLEYGSIAADEAATVKLSNCASFAALGNVKIDVNSEYDADIQQLPMSPLDTALKQEVLRVLPPGCSS